MTLDPIIHWLYSHRAPNIKWELDTMRDLLALMGDPHRRLAPVLIGGTNGKGSVAAMLHAIVRASGRRAGLFTSPHLVRPEERVRLPDGDIRPEDFRPRVAAMRELVEKGLREGRLPRHPSFFEMTAAIAMHALADADCDVALLEVGLGGRLDATNVVEPMVSVITNIGLEHTKTLGDTTAKIAGEKAGIFREGVPVVSGVTDADARAVLLGRAGELGAAFHDVPGTCDLDGHDSDDFEVTTPVRRYESLRLALAGRHQMRNACVAVRTAEVVGEILDGGLDENAIRDGLATTRWPGRLERVDGAPAFLLDGAHNPDGCRALAGHLEDERRRRPGRRRVLVFAAMGDKHAAGMLGALAAHVDRIVVTRAEIERSAEPDTLLALARRQDPGALATSSSAEALEAARRDAGPEGEVVVAGSLFLIGEVRAALLRLDGAGNPSYARVPRATQPAPLP